MKNKTIHMSLKLLPPFRLLALLVYKNPETKIYNFLKDKYNLSINIKTFKKTEWRGNNPPINIIEKLNKSLSGMGDLLRKKWRDAVSGIQLHEWESVLDSIHVGAPRDGHRIFPVFQKKLREIITVEKAISSEVRKTCEQTGSAIKALQIAQIYKSQPYVKYLLSEDEYHQLCTTESDTEAEEILALIMIKTILYCAAYIDAEFSIDKDEVYSSVILTLLPQHEKEGLKTSTEQFFEHLREHTGTFKTMALSLAVSTNNNDLFESQKRKLNQWKSRKRIAKDNEIRKLINGIFPDIDKYHYLGSSLGIIYYRLANMLDNLHDALLSAKVNEIYLFRTDNQKLAEVKVVEWVTENFERFHRDAYGEVTLARGVTP